MINKSYKGILNSLSYDEYLEIMEVLFDAKCQTRRALNVYSVSDKLYPYYLDRYDTLSSLLIKLEP